jgi:N-acetylglutamate synthase-like GNAT family acetyltransferase
MRIHEVQKNNFLVSTDKTKLDIDVIHHYLCNESYWAKNIPKQTVQQSIEGSVCFGLYDENKQVGFARVITDHATFGYLADVFIIETYRGKGLAKWMMEVIMNDPNLQGFRRWMLATRDAHGLYAQFGFQPLDKPERIMRYSSFDEYLPGNNKQ